MPREIVDLSPVITPDLNIQRLGTRTLAFLGTEAASARRPCCRPIRPSPGACGPSRCSATPAPTSTPPRACCAAARPPPASTSAISSARRGSSTCAGTIATRRSRSPISSSSRSTRARSSSCSSATSRRRPTSGRATRRSRRRRPSIWRPRRFARSPPTCPPIVRFDDIENRLTRAPAARRGLGRVPAALPGRHPDHRRPGQPRRHRQGAEHRLRRLPAARLPIGDGAPMRAAALVYCDARVPTTCQPARTLGL